jgi:3-dehydroquinate synthase
MLQEPPAPGNQHGACLIPHDSTLLAVRYHRDTVPVIPVNTPSASYDVTISAHLLRTLYPRISKLNKDKTFRPFIITSPDIWALWSNSFLASFSNREQDGPTVLFVPSGESHKRLSSVESLAQQLATAGADRDSLLLAFGGGVLGDMTGFLAAIYMRGIRYVQIPTTLLAQVDSSIGGKTGVNLLAGKNLIGSFHHPQAVFVDTGLLATLPSAELRAGLQESIKAGIIYDAKLFRYMEQNAEAILAGDPAALTQVVAASVRVKADVVSKDEKESGLRMILNFGHTIGHAIEAATNYKQLLHGEAVAWGSIAALNVARNRKTINSKQADRIESVILRYGPPPRFKATAEKLVALTSRDKKNRSGVRSFVLPTAIGKTEIVRDVTEPELLAATESMLIAMRRASRSSS